MLLLLSRNQKIVVDINELCSILIDELVGSLHPHERQMNQYDDTSHLMKALQSGCPPVTFQAIAVIYVAELATEVKDVEGNLSTEASVSYKPSGCG